MSNNPTKENPARLMNANDTAELHEHMMRYEPEMAEAPYASSAAVEHHPLHWTKREDIFAPTGTLER